MTASLSIPGPMSRPYQPAYGTAASRFFLWKSEKSRRRLTYLSISLLCHGGRLMMEKQKRGHR